MRRPDYGPPQGDQSFMNRVLQMMFTPWQGDPWENAPPPRHPMIGEQGWERTIYKSGLPMQITDPLEDPEYRSMLRQRNPDDFRKRMQEYIMRLQQPEPPPQPQTTGPRRWY